MFEHELGSFIKSKVVGFEGTLTARAQHLYGCNRYMVQPKVGSDGKVPDSWWIDEMDIEIIKHPIKKEEKAKKVGGPMSKMS